MAKRRKHRRGLKGFGNIISVRRGMDGLFDTGTVVGDAAPVVLGAAATVGVAALIRKVVPMATSAAPASPDAAVANAAAASTAGVAGISDTAVLYAPLLGGVVGALAGLGLVYGMRKRTAGTTLMAASLTTGLLLQYREKFGLAGLGAIVPQYGMGAVMPMMNGLGATVLEPWPAGHRPDSIGALGDAYGTSVDLAGLGDVNTGAFGTPGFHV